MVQARKLFGAEEQRLFPEGRHAGQEDERHRFNRFISANIGQAISSAQLLDEFEKDFGAGRRGSANLLCDKAHGKTILSEVRIYLKKTLLVEGKLDEMLTNPEKSERGDCPEEFSIDEVLVSEN